MGGSKNPLASNHGKFRPGPPGTERAREKSRTTKHCKIPEQAP